MRFRVLTYNIHRAIGVDRRFRPERIVSIMSTTMPTSSFSRRWTRGRPARGRWISPRSWPRISAIPTWPSVTTSALTKGPLRQRHPQPLSHPARTQHRPHHRTAARRRGCQHTAIDAARVDGASRTARHVQPASGPLGARARRSRSRSLARSGELLALALDSALSSWRATSTTGGPASCHGSRGRWPFGPPPGVAGAGSARYSPTRGSSRRALSTGSITGGACACSRRGDAGCDSRESRATTSRSSPTSSCASVSSPKWR